MNLQPGALQRLIRYQQVRFPVIALALTLLPAILSSGAMVLKAHPAAATVGAALLAALSYLFHIRVLDEQRDADHDSMHHTDRPLQTGVITQAELVRFDWVALAILVGIALMFGQTTTLLALGMLGYSYVARREFFLSKRLRQSFFLYNAINLVQMLLLQLFLYALFASGWPSSLHLEAHFLFTTVGTLLFEFIRKVRIPGQDGTGQDTYTWYLGFGRALLLYSIGLVLLTILAWLILSRVALATSVWTLPLLGLGLLASLGLACAHWSLRNPKSDQAVQLSLLCYYGLLHLAIYVAITGNTVR